MTNTQMFTDKTAIGLSLLCAFHCLALPLFIVIFPSIAALKLDNEAFHYWMIVAVIPTSVYAWSLGCKQHKRKHLLLIGFLGLALLVLAIVLGEPLFGEWGEKVFTLMGASLIAYGHFRNYHLCQVSLDCQCVE